MTLQVVVLPTRGLTDRFEPLGQFDVTGLDEVGGESDQFAVGVLALLEQTPDMPATVLAERVGWTESIRWFRDNVKRLRARAPAGRSS